MKKTGDFGKEFFYVMRLFIISILFTSLATVPSFAQSPVEISLNIDKKPLTFAIETLQKESDYSFFYYDGLINPNQKITIKGNFTIKQALDRIFANTNNSYVIEGKQVFICKKGNESKATKNDDSAKITATGTVTEVDGSPVIGATVVAKGSTNGVITDYDGNFTLPGIQKGASVTISYLGFTPVDVLVSNDSPLKVVLSSTTIDMDEVVVVGYGTQRRSMVTNAVSKFKPDEGNIRQALSPAEMLQGRVAGMSVSSSSGNLGSAERVSIRGSASLNASNEPLYVVDGIPLNNEAGSLYAYGENMSSLAVLNLTDIESIEVLKDAASAAIYGSRATNGVVLITTKQGREGKSEFKLNYTASMNTFPNKDRIQYADSKAWVKASNAAIDNYNNQMGYTPDFSSYVKHLRNPYEGLPDTDWLDQITQTGVSHNLAASFSGGSKNTQFYIGGNYQYEEGIIKCNDITKINLKTNITHKIGKWFEIGGNMSGNYLSNNRVPGASLGSNIIARAVEQRPFDRPYKPSGDYYLGGTNELSRHNPVQILTEATSYVDNYRFLGVFFAKAKITDKIDIKASYNSDVAYTLDYLYYNANHPYREDNGRAIEKNRLIMTNMFDVFANYNDKFGLLDVNAMAGHSFLKTDLRTNSIDAQNFPSPSFGMVGSAAVIAGVSGGKFEYAIESYFGRLSLGYDEKYIINATVRADGSSRFAPEHRWGYFPSVSAGWNISNESFWNAPQTDLKIRASYGKTGNQDGISNYGWQPLIGAGSNYLENSGIAVTARGNDKLTWETADQYNAGIDLSLLKGKINVIFDVYQKNTANLLYNMPMASTTGFTSLLSNIGSMENKGVEFTLDTHAKLGHVSWNSSFNITHNKNKLTKLINDDIISLNAYHALKVGEEIGAFYLLSADGLYQYDGEIPQEQYNLGVRAGDRKYIDYDNNGIINDKDRVMCGSTNPKFSGGWSNTFKYKGFDLSLFLTYSYGGKVYSAWQAGPTKLGSYHAMLKSNAENFWTGPGSTNTYPRPVYSYYENNVKVADNYLYDSSNIRLRSLSLGYTFPASMLRGLSIKALRVFAQGENLCLISKYPGWDPDATVSIDPALMGVDNYGSPQPMTFKVGFNFSF